MKIIKFNAVWCPSCLVSKKIWKSILEDYPDLEVIDYDYDIDEDMVLKYDVKDKLPVVIKTDDDLKEIKRLIGEKSKEEIISFIEE